MKTVEQISSPTVLPPSVISVSPKELSINEPGNVFEQEADRVADHAMRMQSFSTGPNIKDALEVRPVEIANAGKLTAPSSVHEVLRSPGHPLDPTTCAMMKSHFSHDFSQVRVFTGAAAHKSAQDINARAYTVGNNIVFNEGEFAPTTQDGRRLLCHELAHVLQQGGSTARTVFRQPPAHARGYGGEQGMGFIHYSQEDGWILFEGPSGAAGHGTTESGFDAVAYNTRTGEVHLVDNKSVARAGNVSKATAIDPAKNLTKNVDALIERVEAAKDVPGRIKLLGRLRELKSALASGQPVPKDIKLVVTGVGGRASGVSEPLGSRGVEYRNEPKRQPVSKPQLPVEGSQPGPTTKAEPHSPPPAEAPITSPPITEPPVAGPPVVTPAPVGPRVNWKGGLKAGGKALAWVLVFAGLDYLVHKSLEKDLEASIDKAMNGGMGWARRVKREDPSKPVYMKILFESKDYSMFWPFLGWLPEPPVLHLLSIEFVRDPIDPPVVVVRDDSMDPFHPGITRRVTYTELMIP